MKTTIVLCYFAINLLSASSPCGAEVSVTDADRLDSLLLTGDPKAAMTYWLTACGRVTEDTGTTVPCQTTTELLQNLLEYVTVFEITSRLTLDRLSRTASHRGRNITNHTPDRRRPVPIKNF